MEEFAELWKAEVDLPFAVYGVIPNYVKQDKFELLTWAGMNRIRMGIQSGSEHILEFYKRPSPPAKIRAASQVIGNFAPEYHLPPAYDLIVDNPIETRKDVVDTLELIYEMPRPYTLFIYSLKVIPNTELERLINERGIELDEIDSSFFVIPPRVGNLLLYVLCLWKPPRWLWTRLLNGSARAPSRSPCTRVSASCSARCTSPTARPGTSCGWTSRSSRVGPATRSGGSARSAGISVSAPSGSPSPSAPRSGVAGAAAPARSSTGWQ